MTDEQLKQIGDRIAMFRKSLDPKVSQAEFGAPLEMGRGVVNNLEMGVTKKPEPYLKSICGYYRINYRWLVEGIGPMEEAPTVESLTQKYLHGESELTKAIVQSLAGLSDESWEQLKTWVESIRKEGL